MTFYFFCAIVTDLILKKFFIEQGGYMETISYLNNPFIILLFCGLVCVIVGFIIHLIMSIQHTANIENLERLNRNEIVEIRKQHANEIVEIRKQHANEKRIMKSKIIEMEKQYHSNDIRNKTEQLQKDNALHEVKMSKMNNLFRSDVDNCL